MQVVKKINQSINKTRLRWKANKRKEKGANFIKKETKVSISIKTVVSNQSSTGKVWVLVGRRTRGSKGKVASVVF